MKKIICNYKLFTYTQNAIVMDVETGKMIETVEYNLDNVKDVTKMLLSRYDDIESLDLYGIKPFSQKIKDNLSDDIFNYNHNIKINIY